MDVAKMTSMHSMIDHYRKQAAREEKRKFAKVIAALLGDKFPANDFFEIKDTLLEYGFELMEFYPSDRTVVLKRNCYDFILQASIDDDGTAVGELIKREGES